MFFLILVIATITQRIAELVHSHANQLRMTQAGFNRADSRFSYLCMVIVHSTWFLAMLIEHWWRPIETPIVLGGLALSAFVIAQGLRFWALRSLGVQWNVNVMTPQSAVTSEHETFIAIGPYRYVRHPNYLAVIIEFATLPLIGGAIYTTIVWSLLNAAVLYFRIRDEEQLLFSRPGYREVMGSRPRLLWGLIRL